MLFLFHAQSDIFGLYRNVNRVNQFQLHGCYRCERFAVRFIIIKYRISKADFRNNLQNYFGWCLKYIVLHRYFIDLVNFNYEKCYELWMKKAIYNIEQSYFAMMTFSIIGKLLFDVIYTLLCILMKNPSVLKYVDIFLLKLVVWTSVVIFI